MRIAFIASLALAATACGGGGGGNGGGGGTPTPAPTVTLNAAAASVASGGATTLTWSSTSATACTASGAWTGNRATSGSESTGALTSAATYTLTCTGGGGSGNASTTVNVTTAGPVTVSGTITYARVPHNTGSGSLNYANISQEPARGITVEIVGATSQTVLATTTTDGNGAWSASVPGATTMFVRAKAALLRPASLPLPHWNVTVGDPDNAVGVYSVDSAPFGSGTGAVQGLAIPSGWDPGTRQPISTRASAPFAILDSIWRGLQFVAATVPTTDFPRLAIDWSTDNPGGETFYRNSNNQPTIVLSGQANVDIDEFDAHTILHEFGHYLEDQFSRSDSIGGAHGFGDILDPRVAFGEGWGYAFAAMALNDPVVRDAAGDRQLGGAMFSVETDTSTNRGWFSESSVQEILWDFFDPPGDAGDTMEIGFAPLWTVMTGEQRTSPAFTSIFSFVTKLKEQRPDVQAAIDTRLGIALITGPGMDIYGTNETHTPAGTVQVSDVLPVYTPIAIGSGPVTLHTTGAFDPDTVGNRLSVSRFLRLNVVATQTVRVTATPIVAGRDVDLYIVRSGAIAGAGTTPNAEDFTMTLTPGDYVIDVHDCGLADCGVPAVTGASDIDVTIAPN